MLEIKNLYKSFGKTSVLGGINITIKAGELFFLLGPSGCGKSTLLRIIAGLESPDKGSISFNGEIWNNLLPEERRIGMVFQQYSLWPHMTVAENVGYGLKLRKLKSHDINQKVTAALEQVGLSDYAEKKPGILSGGQQQRAAVARALVLDSRLLLLDEPLSNLDATLRIELRSEIKELQRRLNLTMIYVTHDQEEAMTLADRMALINDGIIEQIDTPEAVYRFPETVFAARFFGKSALLPTMLVSESDSAYEIALGETLLRIPKKNARFRSTCGTLFLVVKPNSVFLSDSTMPGLTGIVTTKEYFGTHHSLSVTTPFGAVSLLIDTGIIPQLHETVHLGFKEDELVLIYGENFQ